MQIVERPGFCRRYLAASTFGFGFWVAQRFSAAMDSLFSGGALAPEVRAAELLSLIPASLPSPASPPIAPPASIPVSTL